MEKKLALPLLLALVSEPRNSTFLATNVWERMGAGREEAADRAPSPLWLVSAPRSGCDFVPSSCLPVLYAVFAIKASLWMCRCEGASLLKRRGRGVSAHWGRVGTWPILLFPFHFKLVSIKRVSSREEPRPAQASSSVPPAAICRVGSFTGRTPVKAPQGGSWPSAATPAS